MATDSENLIFKSSRFGILTGIRSRLIIGFGAITFLLIISIAIVLFKITAAKDFATEVIDTIIPTYNAYLDLNGQIYHTQSSLNAWVITRDMELKSDLQLAWKNIDKAQEILDQFSKNWPEANHKKWQEIVTLLKQMRMVQSKIENATDQKIASQMIIMELKPISLKIFDILDGEANSTGERAGGLFDTQAHLLNSSAKEIITTMNAIRSTEVVLLISGLIFSIFIAWLTVRGILYYVNTFRHHSKKVASGDLTQRIVIESNDEMGMLGNDLNAMTENLAAVTKQITKSCINMVTTLEEVKRTVNVQSAGASEQASSINEITSSLEEIGKSSHQTIEKAKMLGDAAERTREKGQLGLEAVEQSVIGMKSVREKVQTIAQTILELSHQTQQVGEITAVVNTLAQQSKMLALNASIEAAKAGEAGKGFSVVAAEVKNLAEQSEQSTTQVQKILEDIRHATEKAVMATEEGTKGVDHGTNLVEQTGGIVKNLTDVIYEATIASQQIEAAIRQEGIGIEQITAAMNEINQVTSSFVESVKQTIEAMNDLATIADSLKEHIDVYKI